MGDPESLKDQDVAQQRTHTKTVRARALREPSFIDVSREGSWKIQLIHRWRWKVSAIKEPMSPFQFFKDCVETSS